MTRITNPKEREYRSELRPRQAEETRTRILDAAVRIAADGFASVSVPAVAREAGVSVPTVYGPFAMKRGLVAALYPRLLLILASSSALRTWRDLIGATVDEAADDLDWIVRAAVGAASPKVRP